MPAAKAAGGSGPPAAANPSPAAAADTAAAAAGTRPKQLTQMYLDVGQRHFHSYRCPTCGMLYARGTDAGAAGTAWVFPSLSRLVVGVTGNRAADHCICQVPT